MFVPIIDIMKRMEAIESWIHFCFRGSGGEQQCCAVLQCAVYAQEFSLSVSDPLIRGPVTKCYARIAAPLRKLLCKLVNNLLSPANISVSKCLFDLTTEYNIHYVLNVKSLFLDPLPMCKLDFYLISKSFGLDPQMEN